MADEDPKVVQPAGGIQDVIIQRAAVRQLAGQSVEAGLMAELIDRLGLGADIVGQLLAPIWAHCRFLLLDGVVFYRVCLIKKGRGCGL